jgi:antirestriction protein ArdC
MSNDAHLSVYDRVTNEIIADLEQGVRPWKQPWSGNYGPVSRPLRHNGEPYNGANVLLLWMRAFRQGYHNPTWMTFKQAEEYGAHVRKGEKSAYVVYANKVTKIETNEKTGEDIAKQIPFLRGYSVFNVEQIEGLPKEFIVKPEGQILNPVERIEKLETFFKHTGADIRHGGGEAYWQPKADYIQMPPIEAFIDAENYYATLAHEATHWTADKGRLDRHFGQVTRGDEAYAKEELVAEIGSAFLCADLGITPEVREDHAAYISFWLKALKDDKKLIFMAAAHASRAAEFLKGLQPVVEPAARPEDDIQSANQTLYTSQPMQIGKYLWRMLIGYNDMGSVGTRYEFQDESGSFWRGQREWARYNINDTYLGLPSGLSKLYEREQPVLVKFGLVSPPAPVRQLDLKF